MTSPGSISFDDAADFYDKTRALSPDAAARITDVLEGELRGRDRVLEIGVGTGRIALPLSRRGVAMTGVDLAPNMLAKLVQNAGGTAPFPLVQGDATGLPFHDASFDAAIVSWVLHLIEDWRVVLAELVRVVRSGGVLAIDVGGKEGSITSELTWRFRDVAGVTDWPRGVDDPGQVDEALSGMGARPRPLDPVKETVEMTLGHHIDLLERGIYSVTWGLDEATRKTAAADLRTWASEKYGSLTEVRHIEATHVWRAYDT
jgi:SAM-dependent methyltransferase